MGLQAYIGGLPRGVGSQQFCHLGFRAAGLLRVKEASRFVAHQVRGAQIGIGLGDGKLNALILSNRPIKDDALPLYSGVLMAGMGGLGRNSRL